MLENAFQGKCSVKADPETNGNEIFHNTIYYIQRLESGVVILVQGELGRDSNLKNLV